ncbi:MAG: cytidine deaminase [Erysipelotrichales bacterium]
MNEKAKETLFKLSTKAFANAYTPYSHFNVGAACLVKGEGGTKAFIGANIENAAYGSSICAERTCITAAYSNGARKDDILAFAVITDSPKPSMPCGECRQVLSELLHKTTPIYVFNLEGDCIETNMETLLPFPFSDEDLREDV